MPFKNKDTVLPNNRKQAVQRLSHTRKRMIRDTKFKDHYTTFMTELLLKGYAEQVPEDEIGVMKHTRRFHRVCSQKRITTHSIGVGKCSTSQTFSGSAG